MKTKTKKPKAVKKPVNKPQYTANAIIMGKKYQGKGKTVSEAIGKLEIRNCRGKCILTVSDGTTSKERVMMPQIVSRLFSLSGMTREIALKQASSLFF